MAASLVLGEARHDLLECAILWLLTHPWVETDGVLHKVCRGSGMGLRDSSNVCDAALMALVETNSFVGAGVKEAASILAYYGSSSPIVSVSAGGICGFVRPRPPISKSR